MRHGLYGGVAALTAVITLAGPPAAHAQQPPAAGAARARPSPTDFLTGTAGGVVARGQIDTTYSASGEPSEKIPIPTGSPGNHGIYTFFEFVYLTTTWPVGDQTVAYRGLVDSTGQATGVPGTYIGSGQKALSTNEFGRRSWLPGYNIGVGYKTDDGVSVYASYLQTFTHHYTAGASSAAPFFRSAPNLSDTFLVAGVYNFPSQFAGPTIKTNVEATVVNSNGQPGQTITNVIPNPNTNAGQNPTITTITQIPPAAAGTGGNIFYGIWNGASNMTITFDQWFDQAEIGGRVPLLQTETSRVYGLAGGRFDWFMERFQWYTDSLDISGTGGPTYSARYNNTLSQRMYGPYVGCGHEAYIGNRFSVSTDFTAAGLLNIVKERAKYKLEDNSIQNKRTVNDYTLVPSLTANVQLWWYPIEGVQVRAGYNAMTFFNTKNMLDPIGFNYGAIDPVYNTQVFRIVHGLNFGAGLFF